MPTTSTYGYDGDGRRVRSTVGGQARYFVLDPAGNVLAEYDNAGALLVEHVYLGDKRIGSRYSNGKRTYAQHDAIGSDWILTSDAGTPYERFTYWPFGEAVNQFQQAGAEVDTIFTDGFQSGTMAAWVSCNGGAGCVSIPEDVLEPRFTGKELDLETGLFYFEARYLDPRIGRFTSPDEGPLKLEDPQSFNRYSYVQNSPYKYKDPDGRSPDLVLDVGFIVYDVFDIARSAIRGEGVSRTQWGALGADAFGALVPGLTGGGVAVRAAARADDVAKAARGAGSALREASSAALKAADEVAAFRVPAKHLPGAGGRYAKFGEGVNPQGAIAEALRSPGAVFSPNNLDGSFRVTTDLGRAVGSRGETAIRVVVGNDGKIWTAFPVKRR